MAAAADRGGFPDLSAGSGAAAEPDVRVPVPMNLYATWEIDRSSPSCVPRNIIENLFREAVEQRRAQIQANLQIRRCLRAFQRIGDNMARFWTNQDRGAIFFYAVLIALLCVAVLLYLFFSGVVLRVEIDHYPLY